MVENQNLFDHFHFHLPTMDVIYYQKADVFCLPSFYEGFPNVICEAMACGKPVLASSVCDNTYLIEDGINGFLFNPFDSNSIAKAIKSLIELSQNERLEMGKRSRQIVENKTSQTKFLQKYIKLINQ